MHYTSSIELSQSALKSNIKFLKKMFGKNVRFSSVVKGNAYGHGIEVFVPLAEECGINHFSTFSAAEAARVLKSIRKKSDIMIMGMIDTHELKWAIENKIQFWVFDFERLESAINTAKKLKKKAKIHIEVETGFNRTGFVEKDLNKLLDTLTTNRSNISFEGLCTHYAGAESIANHFRVQNQRKKFNKLYKKFVTSGLKPKLRHTACSAAAITYPETRMDLVRIGISQYGFWPSRETLISYINSQKDKSDPLERVLSWKSKLMSVKNVKTGEFVGYGTSFLAQRDTKIGIVPVGYSVGFSRAMSNHGRALINGHRVAVIGIVNMNHLIMDVTDVRGVKTGDEVVLIGEQHDLCISVSSFSELSHQLNYESLCRLAERIPRKVIS